MEHWFALDVEDIDDDSMIKVHIVPKIELEPSRGLAMALAVDTVL
jgi:hypothetical protein